VWGTLNDTQNEERRVIKKMNKKILMSIFIIGLLAFGLGWGTYSYFSDTEKSVGNVFTAGTIDIAVNSYNPWSDWTGHFELNDMKPCETGYIVFDIQNVGTNPVNVWKHLTNVVCGQGIETEPEIEEEKGVPKCDIDTVITYDLSVEVYNAAGEKIWWQVIIPPEAEIKVSDVECHEIPLGMIPVGGHMKVIQSYHLQAEVTNWAQGDKMTFDIEIYGEQLNGPEMPGLFLVPKEQAGPTGETGKWIIKWNDVLNLGIYGELKYNTKGPTFDYEFDGSAPLLDTDYDLIYYPDPWPGTGLIVIGSGHSNAVTGDISFSGSINLDTDLPIATDYNYPDGAKIWLVLHSDNDGAKMTAWNPAYYLFEFSLIKYDDTNAP
jgi:predicted ribosomally synthesized peptide with SipW-like signal peptide